MPSTVIRSNSYDPETSELTITFVTGRRYVYDDVPQDVYAAFKAAFSRGTFFNRHIRDHYGYREITREEASG
jgi:lysyl-tRNA synthetase class 2